MILADALAPALDEEQQHKSEAYPTDDANQFYVSHIVSPFNT
jgi:hypothetical protein